MEEEFRDLQDEATTKYRTSGDQLDLALVLRNRTNDVRRMTADQLLQVESKLVALCHFVAVPSAIMHVNSHTH